MTTVRTVGTKHSRDDMVAAVAAVAVRDGIAKLTYRNVAHELGTSDRMVVYYFPTKVDLVMAAVTALSTQMQALLENAFGNERRLPDDLLVKAWPVFKKRSADRIFGVFLELVGMSAAKTEPYGEISRMILNGWADWLAERVDAPTPHERRRMALAVMARVDGLLLLRHVLSPAAADDAARALRVTR